MEAPDILNSKIKNLRIELPHYSFSHSASGDSQHTFIGRERILEKLKKVIEASHNEPGVYLVTGNRGVGKTSLVSEVIKKTSLQAKSNFTVNLRYFFLFLFFVAGTQFVLQILNIIPEKNPITLGVILFFLFLSSILLCLCNGYRHKIPKQATMCNKIKNCITSACEELLYFINPYNPYLKTQYVLKIIFIVSFTQFLSLIPCFTPIIAFFVIIIIRLLLIIRKKSCEYIQKYKKEIFSKKDNILLHLKNLFSFFLFPIWTYIKNYDRLYLRINFGHKLKDEKDILRLIVRTLSTEYNTYCHSIRRMLPWRLMVFGFLFIFASLFSHILEGQKLYELIKNSDLYKYSSQSFLNNNININDVTYKKKGSFYIKDDKNMITVNGLDNITDKDIITINEMDKLRLQRVFPQEVKRTFPDVIYKAKIFLLILDQSVFEITKIVKEAPDFFWKGKNDFSNAFFSPINYLFWISFFLTYLFFVFLFRTTWIKYIIVTHRIIMQRLKDLNSDITHSTERENSININSGNPSLEIETKTKTKKIRNIADAREIEKELQDILNYMQQIPIIMCRPSIVIVFDELDKVEPGDASQEKENPQTKASLFSIDATRERQTEILKILSNMKYFLSTARAKFIFIAGREMFDIHLADVSERNNYIGSIFNVVIYVPSFLTDHPTDKKILRQESSIASLPEEFVCRKLIPHDYKVESYDLKNYQVYLENGRYKFIQNNEKQKKIKQKIKDIITTAGNEKMNQINMSIKDERNKKKIQKIIHEQNKKLEQKIIIYIKKEEIDQKEVIDKQKNGRNLKDIITSIENEEIKQINKFIEQNEVKKEIVIKQNKKIVQEIQEIFDYVGHEEIQKIIAVLQQFIIYLAHVSKGAPKKMMQLFESFVEIHIEKDEKEKTLLVQRYPNSSRHFLYFNYYKQYTLGIIAYLITPIFYRLSESNIKEHSDKLVVSSLRFVDFLFKFHKNSFSWKILDISPEMLEVNRAPELKSIAVDLLNYLTQVHINKSTFSLSEYKFDGLIANEIFAMAKTDEVFSALFSFSLDETLPLKKRYQDLLENTKKEYQNDKTSSEFIDAISSLQVVLGDLCYYNDELEEAEVYYKSAVQALRKLEQKNYDKQEKQKEDEKMTLEQLYVYVKNMLRLGMIYEKRKQYDLAYLTYGELCKRIIRERDIAIPELKAGVVIRKDKGNGKHVFVKISEIGKINKNKKNYNDNVDFPTIDIFTNPVDACIASPQPLYFKRISPSTNDMLIKKMTFEGLKLFYLPFIAKLQILEKSFIGGINPNHLEQLDKEFKFLTSVINHNEAKLLEAEFYSRVADILYYKNSDLKCKKDKNREADKDEDKQIENKDNLPQNYSCTACYYYHKALSILLGKSYLDKPENKSKNTLKELLSASIKEINKKNYNMIYYTVLARILSDWGNVFFSCDIKDCNLPEKDSEYPCYIGDINIFNTKDKDYFKINSTSSLEKYIHYMDSEYEKEIIIETIYFSKMEIAFAMYTISLEAYRKANLYKHSAFQIYKMLCLFKHYDIYNIKYIKQLSEKAIHYLWYANEDLNVFELNKRKYDFNKNTINDEIPLQNLLIDSEITRIFILVKKLELKSIKNEPEKVKKLKEYYDMRITSPYKTNYSIVGRISRLWLKSEVNYNLFQILINDKVLLRDLKNPGKMLSKILGMNYNKTTKEIFGYHYIKNKQNMNINILENLIAETIYCLIDIIQLSETMDETYLFPHSFLGSIHKNLSFWISLYEIYELQFYEEYEDISQIKQYLEDYLGKEWREQLSSYRENQRALSHYYKCLELHKEGRAYHNMIDTMCYLKDDFNDQSDHFNIAEERHLIVNGKIDNKINELKFLYKDSNLHKLDNYW